MKHILDTCVFVCAAALMVSGCSKLSLEGESSPLNVKVISVAVPADPLPPVVQPVPTTLAVQAPVTQQPRTPVIPLEPARPPGAKAYDEPQDNGQGISADSASAVYDRALLTEDVTWRGTVLIKGFVVVAPQATLRIEAGTIVRFAGTGAKNNSARLVVQGRIQAVGTAERPIVMTSDRSKPGRGDWGGISLVSSEKRNLLEQCRIEYADTGIDARYSTLSLKIVSVIHVHTGILMRDAVVQMTGATITESETGIEMHDSELDARDSTIAACKRGIAMNRSAVSISSVNIRDNEQYGLLSEDCRIKMTAVEVAGNGSGARLRGGEGQILMARFSKNRETALHLSGARVKIQSCQFADNSQDALRLEDGQALVWGNAFSANNGFNLYNAGREDVSALQNWWGSSDQSAIMQKIYDAVRDPRSGSVQLFPWLTEKSPLMP